MDFYFHLARYATTQTMRYSIKLILTITRFVWLCQRIEAALVRYNLLTDPPLLDINRTVLTTTECNLRQLFAVKQKKKRAANWLDGEGGFVWELREKLSKCVYREAKDIQIISKVAAEIVQ